MAHRRRQPLDNASFATLRIFVAVAEAQSFSVAARQLRLAVSTVSKQIAALEADLGFPLIYRNTRRAKVTEAGERFYHRCKAILLEIDQAVWEEEPPEQRLQGHLRVVASPSFAASVLSPLLADFLSRHPALSVDLLVTSATPDLIRDRIDVAFLLRDNPESKMPAQRLAPNRRAFCVAPSYLEQHGRPRNPDDFAHHMCLVSLLGGVHDPWMVRTKDGVRPLPIASSFASDDGNVLRAACLAGYGVANFYLFHAYEELRRGALIELFADQQPDTGSIFAIFPHRQLIQPRTHAFVDHIRTAVGSPPFWEG